MEHSVTGVDPGSIAAEMGIEPGDILESINYRRIRDILDYKNYMASETLLVRVRKPGGLFEYDVEKDPGEDLGLVFTPPTMDKIKRCVNKCIFCFIDQQPQGLRKSLYLKDDDYRLSLLHGSYISLTNLSEGDFARIISDGISPLYISIHTTNPDLRQRMMNHPNAPSILASLKVLKDGGISFHGQIVLCPGINDGRELERTLNDLAGLVPNLLSLSLVPVGITRHRPNLYPLRTYTPLESRKVLEQCARWQAGFRKLLGSNLVYAADEFYLSAGISVPPGEDYHDYPQLENGVGMARLFLDDYARLRGQLPTGFPGRQAISIACGLAAKSLLKPLVQDLKAVENLVTHFYALENCFFGKNVTVTGLLTGRDLLNSLRTVPLGTRLFLSSSMLKDGKDLFLDGLTVEDVEKGLQTRIIPVEGIRQFVDELSDWPSDTFEGGHQDV